MVSTKQFFFFSWLCRFAIRIVWLSTFLPMFRKVFWFHSKNITQKQKRNKIRKKEYRKTTSNTLSCWKDSNFFPRALTNPHAFVLWEVFLFHFACFFLGNSNWVGCKFIYCQTFFCSYRPPTNAVWHSHCKFRKMSYN